MSETTEVKAAVDALAAYVRTEFERGSRRFERLEEKVDCVREDMTTVVSDVAVARDKVDRVHRAVLEGNGKPAMTERLATVEQVVEENRRALAAPQVTTTTTTTTQTDAVRAAGITAKWQFWAVVVPVVLLLLANIILSLVGKAPLQHP